MVHSSLLIVKSSRQTCDHLLNGYYVLGLVHIVPLGVVGWAWGWGGFPFGKHIGG